MTRGGLRGALAMASLLIVLLAVPGRPSHATKPLVDQLCLGRTPCKIVKQYPAGRDAGGKQLRVVELALEKGDSGNGNACRPYLREFWLAVGPGNRVSARKIMSLCNDGYGAAGIGEDTIKVSANRLVRHKFGGSSWRWDTRTVVQLSPLKVLREETCSYHNISVGFEIDRWDWRRFAGHRIMQFKPGKEDQNLGCEPNQATHRFRMLPRFEKALSLPPAANPALGSCALEMREDDTDGHVVFGKRTPKGTGARLRVLALGERTLLVTVDDKRFATGRNWVHSDHVEVWQGGLMSIDVDYLTNDPLRQFGIRAADGKLFAGHVGGKGRKKGTPEARAEVVAHAVDKRPGGVTLRLRLKMPRNINAITVVYSKARGGRQARLTATSRFKFGRAKTLGGTFSIVPGAARCAVRKGRLDVARSGATGVLLKD